MNDLRKAAEIALEAFKNTNYNADYSHYVINGVDGAELITALTQALAKPEQKPEPTATSIHYPDCWDTACYPTLQDAIKEIGLFKCTNDDCSQPEPDHGFDRTASHMAGEYVDTAEQEPAIGDIRALKHRIHELEGEVIGYKQILKDQDEQEPVAWQYQEYRSAFMGNLQWFDEVQFVQPPNDPERFRNIKPLYTAPLSKQEPVEYDAPALYKAKAEREKDPLCWLKETGSIGGGYEQTAWGDTSGFPVFTAPPSKPWVGLTDNEIEWLDTYGSHFNCVRMLRALEAILRSKNT